jgi:hypothetical protein
MERKRAPFLGMQREIRTERDLAKREEGQMKSACVPNNRGEVVGVRRCLGGRGSSRLPGEGGLISSRFGARHQAAGGLALAAKQVAAHLQER